MRLRSDGTAEEETTENPVIDHSALDLNEIPPDRMFSHLVRLGFCSREGNRLPVDAGTPSTSVVDEPLVLPPVDESLDPTVDPLSGTDAQLRMLLMRLLTPLATTSTGSTSYVALPTNSRLRFPDPPSYDGDPAGLEGWVTSVSMYLRASGVDLQSPSSADVACMFLRGRALDWYSAQSLLSRAGTPNSELGGVA